ncbi:SixA phosphatase family protein [Consotaella aegiceratis]|uniref:SixA phosphatase family protein n=1 Tax=Consotaella aegiceratis TaxID=3097961 RepID=UPI002F41CA72
MSDTPRSRLVLIRHAHAARGPAMHDSSRPLDERGRQACVEVADLLRSTGHRFDGILCSPTVRTRETLSLVVPEAGDAPVRYLETLYLQGTEAYFEAVRTLGGSSTLLVGHNPMTHAFAHALCGSGENDGLAALAKGFPTAAVAVIEFARPLDALEPGSGELIQFFQPKK